MKRTLLFFFILLALLASLAGTMPAHAQACTDATDNPIPCPDSAGGSTGVFYRFLGVDENYLNPANWNFGGRVPSTTEDVLIDGLTARIFPTDPTPIPLGDVTLRNGAALIVRNARLTAGRIDSEGSTFEMYNSYIKADVFRDPPFGGFSLNPSYLEADTIIIEKAEVTGRFGLGGADPADPDHLGEGRYANMRGGKVQLDGQLEVFFVYGFKPEDGQRFIIVNVDGSRTGEFRNAPEGGRVGGYCDIALTISYNGGDGNDVELRASRVADPDPNWGCLSAWPQGDPPAPSEDIFLNGEFAAYTGNLTLHDITLRNDATLILRDATITAARVDSEGSSFEMYNSYLKADVFRDPLLGGYSLNPSLLEADTIIIEKAEVTGRFGLGGDQPARPDGRGAGYYANMRGNFVQLDGNLEIFLVYGFQPEEGQRFIIVNVDGMRIGEFRNAPEGALINGFCSIQFRITYNGGDGNDVALTAEKRTDPDPLCDETFENPSPEKNILLNASSLDLEPASPLQAKDISLRDNAELNLRNGSLTARHIHSDSSTINLFNFHLKADTVAPGPFGGFNLNPSFLEAERIVINNSNTIMGFGIGGVEQSGAGAMGKGRYAHMRGEYIRLDGTLDIFFVYGFQPQPGQTFQIITADKIRIGEFVNAPEGAVAGGYCDVELLITYTGGDGNDVVLTAQASANPDPAWDCDSAEGEQPVAAPTSAPASPSPEAAPADPEAGSSNLWLYAIAAILLFVVAAVVLRKR